MKEVTQRPCTLTAYLSHQPIHIKLSQQTITRQQRESRLRSLCQHFLIKLSDVSPRKMYTSCACLTFTKFQCGTRDPPTHPPTSKKLLQQDHLSVRSYVLVQVFCNEDSLSLRLIPGGGLVNTSRPEVNICIVFVATLSFHSIAHYLEAMLEGVYHGFNVLLETETSMALAPSPL